MIRIILKGGLGNQMFQYALGKTLALKNNSSLFLDLSFLRFRIPFKKYTPLKDFTYRDYDLDIFGIDDKKGTLLNDSIFDKYFSYPLSFAYNRTVNGNYVNEGSNPYIFKPEILSLGKNIVLEGFWNNYKYFQEYKNEIRNVFDTDKLYEEKLRDLDREIMDNSASVALHIRRGDYLNRKHKSVYVGLEAAYFKQAIARIKEFVHDPHFYIFSADDPDWFEKELDLNKSSFTVVGNEFAGYKNRSHFRFMSVCKHQIISNSTYSWWAAYLNKNTHKIVITPKKWMYQYEFENVPGWLEIEN